jgi:iduronate 2-sulfatase
MIRALISLSCLALLGTAAALGADGAKPNVVFIMADDLNNDLGCYGSPIVQSPNIDRLAARGMRFDRAYCNYPVCNPSRSSMLSGRRPESTHIVDNKTPPRTVMPDATFLPEHFRKNGYRTIKVGKIFHTGEEFEDPRSWDVDIRETSEAKKPPPSQISGPAKDGFVLNDADEPQSHDGKVARQGVAYIEEAATGGKPFFIAVGFRRPHRPFIAPKKYFDLYPPEKMSWPFEPPDHVAAIPKIALTYNTGGERLKPEARRETMAAYYATVSFMDAQVGVVADAIDRLNLWPNTIVLFVSDHGYHLGEHGGLFHKMSVFEQSARVPLIVAAPGKKPGVSKRLVELVDLYPTLIELTGLSPVDGLDGTSFVALLDDPAKPWKSAVFTVVSHSPLPSSRGGDDGKLDPRKLGRSVRTERWRFTTWPDGSKELYDHDVDPIEVKNLAKDPAHAGTVQEMKTLLDITQKD